MIGSMGSHRTLKPLDPKGPRRGRRKIWSMDGAPSERFWDESDWLQWLTGSDPLKGLIAGRELRRRLEQHELRHVREARYRGQPWRRIAFYAGLQLQTAHAKWAHRLTDATVRYPARMSLDDLYREVILDHYRSPRNKRALPEADVDVHRNNPLCGDDITVHLVVKDGVAQDVAFEGVGCSISQASASMMTDQITGKSLAEIEDMVMKFRSMMGGDESISDDELGDLVALKGVTKYPVRIKCAVLAWDALQAGVGGDAD